ncbi:hypothetical protein, partial [Marinobacter shengliensis]|uniref:hypothetical protein n=1 Tax=Marinobacter shengliensis TaxID=1389223 RepID=UPI0035BB8FC5
HIGRMGYPDDERSANDPMHNAETGLQELAITGHLVVCQRSVVPAYHLSSASVPLASASHTAAPRIQSNGGVSSRNGKNCTLSLWHQ